MKKILFSGVQPTGSLTIGTLFGAIKNWVHLQDHYQSYFCIVDLHAITIPQSPEILREKTQELAKIYIACGIDPKKSVLFVQSHVQAHATMAWLLNCHTYMGELEKMTQFKEKSDKHQQRSTIGLFTYPVLMAADILLYDTDVVPVGEDQVQHLELTRDLAKRINNKYTPEEELLKIPEAFVPKLGARIKGLQNPENKMSKSSENKNDTIFILDTPEDIEKKIMKSVTDDENRVHFNEAMKPGISNLLTLLSLSTDKSIKDLENELENTPYGEFKQIVAFNLINYLKPIQEKYYALEHDNTIEEILKKNAAIAENHANTTLKKIKQQIGLS